MLPLNIRAGNLSKTCQNFNNNTNHTATEEDPIYDLPPDDENLDYQSIENSAGN